ncbi:hypothetical protein FOYG_09406 [Fusarium oxysporum NRRL 32931]|uniref:Uncharacterized protein n=1 Tax=Fusarium oxysporum NRRL 32931 TaxID=660029 RepID=W9HZM8_FUSOX|nr:hypothetical protein FOYG_09406 [Fusarium oxysporum NRRL 32931]EWY88054.1 hypothetical protein FOYG_09406 [Fusarium oxysporum NRRL 32931]
MFHTLIIREALPLSLRVSLSACGTQPSSGLKLSRTVCCVYLRIRINMVLALTEQQRKKIIAMDIFGHQQFVSGLKVWSMSWSVCFALQLLFQRASELHLFISGL